MANTTLLSLPTELLDRIYFYLDWNRSEVLYPYRPDIVSISLTNGHLRQSILPWIFRHVTLRLRWVEGALVEPSLFRLRRDYPQLAKYVRSVHIETCFGQQKDPQLLSKAFAVPDEFSSWFSFAVESEESTLDREASHRQRLSHVARGFIEKYFYTEMPSNCPLALRRYIKNLLWKFLDPNDYDMLAGSVKKWFMATQGSTEAQKRFAEDSAGESVQGPTVAELREYRDVRLQLDAFVVALLCLPASVNSITVESIPSKRTDTLQNDFALHMAAISMNIFGDRLHRLAMITDPEDKLASATRNDPVLHGESEIITDTVIRKLMRVDSLVLSNSARGGIGDREFLNDWQIQWHLLGETITQLELSNMAGNVPELIEFVAGFTRLQDLTLNNMELVHARQVPPLRTHINASFWLALLIDLRRQLPDLNFHLRELQTIQPRSYRTTLSNNAIRWLLKEAVPAGRQVGFDRETRLTEDFESFLFLWSTEDSDRGQQAKEARKDGKLVDEAMASRWRNFRP